MINDDKNIPKLKLFTAHGARRYEQAHQIWLILSGWVMMNKKVMTYGELAKLMGYKSQAGRTLGEALGIVSKYCLYNKLPPLSVIVVNAVTNLPGWEGMVRKGYSVEEEQSNVFDIKWYLYRAPTVTTFKKTNEQIEFSE